MKKLLTLLALVSFGIGVGMVYAQEKAAQPATPATPAKPAATSTAKPAVTKKVKKVKKVKKEAQKGVSVSTATVTPAGK